MTIGPEGREQPAPASVIRINEGLQNPRAVVESTISRARSGEKIVLTPGILSRRAVNSLADVFSPPRPEEGDLVRAVGVGQRAVVESNRNGVSGNIHYAGSEAALTRLRAADSGKETHQIEGFVVGIVSTTPDGEKAKALTRDFVDLGVPTATPTTEGESLLDRFRNVSEQMPQGPGLLVVEVDTDVSELPGLTQDLKTFLADKEKDVLLLTKPQDEQALPLDAPTSADELAAITGDEDYRARIDAFRELAAVNTRIHQVGSSRHFGVSINALPGLFEDRQPA